MRWTLVVFLALAGCKKGSESEAPARPVKSETAGDAAFWAWITAHLADLKAVKTGHEPVTDQLSAELEKIHPGLAFELGVGRDPFELIISADGNKDLFVVVNQLVAAAPAIPATKVIAFRPRKDVEAFSMQVGERKLSGKNLWFTARPDRENKRMLTIEIFVEGMTPENQEQLKSASFLLLEAAAGEFDLETKVGSVTFKPAPLPLAPTPPPVPLRPLKELPATLDAWK